MSACRLRPAAEADLERALLWIHRNNPAAARRFLESAQELFERLNDWPLAYPLARMRSRRLKALRYAPLSRPFHKWLVFYFPDKAGVDIVRVIYGTVDWRTRPGDFQ